MLEYKNVVGKAVRNNEVLALVQVIKGRNDEELYNICYNPYSCPCYCGPFKALSDVENTVMKHRPGAAFQLCDKATLKFKVKQPL